MEEAGHRLLSQTSTEKIGEAFHSLQGPLLRPSRTNQKIRRLSQAIDLEEEIKKALEERKQHAVKPPLKKQGRVIVLARIPLKTFHMMVIDVVIDELRLRATQRNYRRRKSCEGQETDGGRLKMSDRMMVNTDDMGLLRRYHNLERAKRGGSDSDPIPWYLDNWSQRLRNNLEVIQDLCKAHGSEKRTVRTMQDRTTILLENEQQLSKADFSKERDKFIKEDKFNRRTMKFNPLLTSIISLFTDSEE